MSAITSVSLNNGIFHRMPAHSSSCTAHRPVKALRCQVQAWPRRQTSIAPLRHGTRNLGESSRPFGACCAAAMPAAAATAASSAATASAARVAAVITPLVPPPHTQDPQVIYRALTAPLIAALGGEGSWQLYLASRFAKEVLAGMAAALLLYGIVNRMARQRSGDSNSGSSSSSSSSGGGEALHLAAVALTGPQARLFFGCVLVVNVARNTMHILDGFIGKFNPRLPNDWLDDLVRLIAESLDPLDAVLTKMSLVGTALFGCAVLLRWKEALVSYFVRQHIEGLDKGQELVQNFVNPASNLLNWVLIVAVCGWLAAGLGVNLQPVLAVGGASGILLGLATQQVLANFVSGLNIFLARPFVAGEYISLVSQNLTAQTNVSGRVIRVDPMRTLIATEDHTTIAVPNQVIAVSIVVNRSRSPHWSVGSASPLLACPRELRWRMRLPHAALEEMRALEERINTALAAALPAAKVRCSPASLELVRFTDTGAEVAGKVNLAWRRRGSGGAGGGVRELAEPAREVHEAQGTQEALMQAALLELHRVVRGSGGTFFTN